MKYKCRHCSWFILDRLPGGRCNAPFPQWVPTYFRRNAINVGDDYSNNCQLFRLRQEMPDEQEVYK